MKYIYPAIFEQEDDVVTVRFPDLQGCITEGKTREDAMEMAWDAAALWLATAEDYGDEIPEPSDLSEHKAKNGFVNYIMADTEQYRILIDNKSVKKTLTIPNWLNKRAEKANLNFSQVLQDALKKILHVEYGYAVPVKQA